MNKRRKYTTHAQAFLAQAIADPPAKPGKYDVFLWYEGEKPYSAIVAWNSFTRRAVRLHVVTPQEGAEMLVNADALPNGIEIHRARYLGTFRVEKAVPEMENE